MELKEFIVNTVTEVFEAVKELQSCSNDMVLPGAVAPSTVSEQGECHFGGYEREITPIHFDLVVEAGSEGGHAINIGTEVAETVLGFHCSKKNRRSVQQKISFDLNVLLPSVRTTK